MKKNKNKKKKQIDRLDILMLSIIVLLGIIILFMGVKLIKTSMNNSKEVKANIVIPVLEKNEASTIILSMDEFNKNSEYRFKVNNYRKNKVNKEAIEYTIYVNNEDETDIFISKYGENNNLAQEGKNFKIENNKLKAKKKQSDIYVVKINSKKNINKDSKVRINIES